MTREAEIEKAARALTDMVWETLQMTPGQQEKMRALRAALAQPPEPAPRMEEIEKAVDAHALAAVRCGNWAAEGTGTAYQAARSTLLSTVSRALTASRAEPGPTIQGILAQISNARARGYAEGWEAGADKTRADDVEYLRQFWDDGDQGNANDAAELHLLRSRSLPTPNPEDRR